MSDSLGNAADLQTFPNSWDVLRPKAFSVSTSSSSFYPRALPSSTAQDVMSIRPCGTSEKVHMGKSPMHCFKNAVSILPYCLLGSTPLALLSRTAVSSRQGLSIAGRLPGSPGSHAVHYASVPLWERSRRPFLSFLQCFILSVLGTRSAGHNSGAAVPRVAEEQSSGLAPSRTFPFSVRKFGTALLEHSGFGGSWRVFVGWEGGCGV